MTSRPCSLETSGLACIVGSDVAGRTAGVGAEKLVEQFLASWSGRTRQAYATSLEEFARFRGKKRADAVAELLASREVGRRLVLDFAVELRRRGRAWATVRSRLSTLSSLVRLAGELGVVDWSLEVPSEEDVAREQAHRDRTGGDLPYLLPRHPTDVGEIDRLDVQHYALQEQLGANYLAPLEQPARILDVGCGTGLWSYELCAEFPLARVVGLDLVPSKPPWPATYHFVRANLLQGLPFAHDSFDFVHQRALAFAVPVSSWHVVVEDLVRVAQPGGWVELVEGSTEFVPAGAATQRLNELVQRLSRTRGLDSTGTVSGSLDRYLTHAGATAVQMRTVPLPVGEWGGRIGSLMATDGRALFMRLAPVFEAQFGISERECRELVTAMHQEWEEHHTTYSVAIALGRKPG
ncbi:MAG TPA: class I SAM-dependent methyltransferase [Candidatus Dormibacteraeota bacterium]|nr:class I SAM-dependent methyltransferase [Candidatus Dormibacteraeota bacterium]